MSASTGVKHIGLIGFIRAYTQITRGMGRWRNAVAWIGRVLTGIIQGLVFLALVRLAAALASASGTTPTNAAPVSTVIGVLCGLALAGGALVFARDKCSYLVAFDVMRGIHHKVGNKISILPLGWFSRDVAGSLSRLGAATVNEIGQLSAHLLTQISVTLITVVTIMVGMLVYYPTLGVVLLIAVIAYVLLMWALGQLDLAVKNYLEPANTELAERIIEFASCQPMLRACNRLDYPQLKHAVAERQRRALRSLGVDIFGQFLGGMASQTINILMIVMATGQALAGQLGALEAIAVIGLSIQCSVYLTQLSEGRVGLSMLAPTIATIKDVLDAPVLPEPDDTARREDGAGREDATGSEEVATSEDSAPPTSPEPDTSHSGVSVELRDVRFGYDPHKRVLDGVSFTVPPHTVSAIVGPSGAGKTTIARLICRFWDVNEGAVRVGERDVRDYPTEQLMSQLSMVFQDVYLFDDTLEANVRVGRPDATAEEVSRAAELAGVSEIADRLPDGWETRVGEGGTGLSGGERQRVSVARALLKRAPVVLFDEATSALDAENEANLVSAFNELRKNSTVLVIAHKLGTIAQADQIVVLGADGKIAQMGKHEELVKVAGIYRDFWENRQRAAGWQITG